MRNKHALHGVALGMLVAVVVMLGIVPVLARPAEQAQAAPAAAAPPAVVPQAPGAFHGRSPLVIPAAAFSSDGGSYTSYFFSFAGGYLQANGMACVKAPVYLPKGARIQSVWASIVDSDAANNVSIDLSRVDNYSGARIVVTSLTTAGSGTYIQTPYHTWSTGFPVIEYPSYSYYVSTCLPTANFKLYSLRVYYQQPVLWLPVIKKP